MCLLEDDDDEVFDDGVVFENEGGGFLVIMGDIRKFLFLVLGGFSLWIFLK